MRWLYYIKLSLRILSVMLAVPIVGMLIYFMLPVIVAIIIVFTFMWAWDEFDDF